MERLLIIGGLFVVAGMCEIGGGYLVWGWMREHKPVLWALLGALVLAAYGVVAALQPISEFGRVYAAYGGIFIARAWGVLVDGFRPDRWDLLGAAICVAGVVVMVAPLGDEATLFTGVRGREILRSSPTSNALVTTK
jgi:small multidrug resistance family-3 protein